jgi:hypothetical protein
VPFLFFPALPFWLQKGVLPVSASAQAFALSFHLLSNFLFIGKVSAEGMQKGYTLSLSFIPCFPLSGSLF